MYRNLRSNLYLGIAKTDRHGAIVCDPRIHDWLNSPSVCSDGLNLAIC